MEKQRHRAETDRQTDRQTDRYGAGRWFFVAVIMDVGNDVIVERVL